MNNRHKEKLVIIGGGAAGMSAAAKARRQNPRLEITVIEKSGYISTSLCGIPMLIAGRTTPEKLIARPVSYFEKDLDIRIKTGWEAVSIQRNKRSVLIRSTLNKYEEEIPYDKLVLTTGAKTKTPDIKNIKDKDNLFSISSLDSALRLIKFINDNKSRTAVVIGSGWHGTALSASLKEKGLRVTIIESQAEPFPDFIPEIRALITKKMEAEGIKLLSSRRIFEAAGDKRIEFLNADDERLKADIYLNATGFVPDRCLAEDAGIGCLPDGAILTDSRQRTSDFNIFAAGDCASVGCTITGKIIHHPTAALANKTGYFAGMNAAGANRPFGGTVRTRLGKLFDLYYSRTGLSFEDARMEGYEVIESTVSAPVKPSYVSDEKILLYLLFNKKTGRLLGAQAAGCCAVRSELDLLSAAIRTGMNASQLAELDLSYQPETSNVYHPLHYAAREALKKF